MRFHQLLILALLMSLLLSYLLGYTPLLLTTIYVLVSLICFWQYYRVKKATMNDTWRVPEDTLHLLGLLGGWPGALLAQQKFRHKTAKRSFRFVFWLTVLLNLAAVGWLHTDDANARLHAWMRSVEDTANQLISSDKARLAVRVLTHFF